MIRRHKFLNTLTVHFEQLLIIVLAAIATFAPASPTSAADLLNRRVTIGTSRTSQVTTNLFEFDLFTGGTIGSIEFEYCDNIAGIGAPCPVPAGLDASGATLTNQTGETGFSVHSSTNTTRIVLTRTPAVAAPQTASYDFSNIMNPSTEFDTTFVRISTYASDDASGPRIDGGTVAFATTWGLGSGGLSTTAFVPPFLTFCVGITVAIDCSTATGDYIDFGELLRTLPSVATSQYSAATNDVNGYSVSVFGNTMTSGNNTIPALAVNGPSLVGTSQYGMNLRRNNSPSVGTNPQGAGTAVVDPNYNIPNSFRFNDGETLSFSDLSTQFNRMTVSYLVNASNAQAPGVYVTTMTYVAVADF